MKKLSIILFLLLVSPILIFAQFEKVLPSSIKKATIYPQGAQLQNEVSFPIQKGQMKIKLTGLTYNLNEESIRIISDGSFTILNVQYQTDYINELDKDAETKKLMDKIDELKSKVEEEEVWVKIIKEKIDFLTVNKQINGKNEAINPETFKTMNQIYGSNYETLALDALKRQRLIQKYKDELAKLTAQLQTISNQTGTPSGTIIVVIDGKQAKTAKMVFSYYTWNASWYPSYDIRFTGFNKPLEITYFANIQQTTGVEWKDVDIVLSSAKTQISAQIPFLSPYYLTYFQPVSVTNTSVYQKGAAVSYDMAVTEGSVNRGKDAGYFSPAPQQSVASATSETVKEYIVQNPQTIISSQNTTAVTYGEGTLNAVYDYQTIPKLSENVYLIARILDWGKADLTSGMAKLYLENSYVGKSMINTSQFSDTLDISFGVDNNVTIKREKITSFSEKTFSGSNVKETVGFKITIRNNKSYAITTSVFDQIPISTDEKIVVDLIESSKGNLTKETGKIEWKLNLQPNETKTVTIKYSVKYPKDKKVIVQ
ncbi:MAG TPA: DUF4139 domain-containing protein [Bacteroidales bacterium]|nr:DUF4139 domain-containing protein [Bacteroidales bacterium]